MPQAPQRAYQPGSHIAALYDTYSPMLYGIALDISSGARQAEDILIRTFAKAGSPDRALDHPASACIALIRLLIESAHELLGPTQASNIKLKIFEKTPLMHKMLCERVNLNDYCQANNMTRMEAGKKMREELLYIRNCISHN